METMIRMRPVGLTLLVGVLLLAACGSDAPINPDAFPYDCLAQDCLAAGWEPIEGPRVYRGDALYDYFSTGSEVYREYRCRQVKVQDFKNEQGDRVRVEVFKMASSEDAFGLYSLKTQPGGEIIDVGVQGWIERHVLNFWRGNVQITLMALRARGTHVNRMDFLAISVDQGLTGAGESPAILELLPEKDLLPQGRILLAGPASLKKALGSDPWRFPAPLRGVIGRYTGIDGEHQLVVLEYESKEAAREAGKITAPKGSDLNPARTKLLYVFPEPRGKYLYAYVGPKNIERARVAITRAIQEYTRVK